MINAHVPIARRKKDSDSMQNALYSKWGINMRFVRCFKRLAVGGGGYIEKLMTTQNQWTQELGNSRLVGGGFLEAKGYYRKYQLSLRYYYDNMNQGQWSLKGQWLQATHYLLHRPIERDVISYCL